MIWHILYSCTSSNDGCAGILCVIVLSGSPTTTSGSFKSVGESTGHCETKNVEEGSVGVNVWAIVATSCVMVQLVDQLSSWLVD